MLEEVHSKLDVVDKTNFLLLPGELFQLLGITSHEILLVEPVVLLFLAMNEIIDVLVVCCPA